MADLTDSRPEQLPDYTIPALEVLPNAKVAIQETEQMRDKVRAALREIWVQVLDEDVSNFSDDDTFFDIGGDSKSAQALISGARKLGIMLSMQQVFSYSSINEMADVARLDDYSEAKPEHGPPLDSSSDKGRPVHFRTWQTAISMLHGVPGEAFESIYPCTAMQESLIAEVDGATNSYVRQFVFRLSDDVEIDRLQQAWTETAKANALLRTRIYRIDNSSTLLQAVLKDEVGWSMSNQPLLDFQMADAQSPMTFGTSLSRYTIVESSDSLCSRYFVWTIHHAICDGTSIIEIVREASARYQGHLPRLFAPFSRFVEFVTQETVSLEESKAKNYWRNALADLSPTPFPQPSADLATRAKPDSILMRKLVLRRVPPLGLTRTQLIWAALTILLSHYTGTEDVCFGAINDGRSSDLEGIDSITGPTINLTPVALRVQPEEKIATFMRRVRDQAIGMIPFQHSGISRIRKQLGGETSMAVDFNTLLVVHPVAFPYAIAPATAVMGIEYLDELGKKEQHSYPLVITCTLGQSDHLDLKLEFDSRIMPTQQAENLAFQLQAVIVQVAEMKGNTLLSEISPFSDHDLKLIRQWNSHAPPPEDITVHRLFQKQVRERPAAVAVCSLTQSITYAELDAYSSSLAVSITQLGVSTGTFVGVCFEKSVWTIVAILAAFKAGGIYIPLDVAHPEERRMEIVRQVGLRFIIASPFGASLFTDSELVVTILDGPPQEPREHILLQEPSPSGLAYMLFTSGSTGKPKGILITHTAICTSIVHHGQAYNHSPGSRVLQFGAHTFDISVAEFLTTLAFGGCLCVPSEHDRLNNLAEIITALNVNTLMVVPTVVNLLTPADVPTLRTVILGGEPLPKETVVRWADHVNLTAGYGPSETAVYCAGNIAASTDAHPSNIGRSIGGMMWITNSDDPSRLCAVGCVGEITITGGILGAGYFGDEAATDAAFLPAPAWLKEVDPETPYSRIYRSGDLARYNPDGTLAIIGRRDTQVKLRGFRIELSEIESQIMTSGVTTAALADVPKSGPCARRVVALLTFDALDLDNAGELRIAVSSYVRSPKIQASLEKVKQQTSLNLPAYMVPTVWIVVERLPLLISGKVDRKRLKQWIATMSDATYRTLIASEDDAVDSDITPGSLADTIRHLFADVLGIEPDTLRLNSSFFAQGGDSIAAIVMSNLAKRKGFYIPVRFILKTKSLQQLTALVEASRESDVNGPDPIYAMPDATSLLQPWKAALDRKLDGHANLTVEDAYPLSPFQLEIGKQRSIDPTVFAMSWLMEVFPMNSRELSLPRLSRAWKSVIQTYPIFSSIFLWDSKGVLPPLQVVLTNAEPQIHISYAPAHESEPSFETVMAPLLDDCFLPHRAHFYQHGQRYFVHIELDHRSIDGWSLRLIKLALLQAYEQESSYKAAPPPPYKTFVAAHSPSRVEADDQYWESVLRNQQITKLDFPPPENPPLSRSSRKEVIYLPEIDFHALTEFGVRNGVTSASIFTAAWAQTLSRFTRSSSATFEYIHAGRDEQVDGVFEMVGVLINALACHLQDVTGSELAQLALRVQEQQTLDSQHRASNVRRVVINRISSDLPFNTAVNFQRRPTAVETASLKVDDDLRKCVDPWHFDVLVRILHITDDNTFRPSLEFYAHLFDVDRMKEVANDWWSRVDQVIA